MLLLVLVIHRLGIIHVVLLMVHSVLVVVAMGLEVQGLVEAVVVLCCCVVVGVVRLVKGGGEANMQTGAVMEAVRMLCGMGVVVERVVLM